MRMHVQELASGTACSLQRQANQWPMNSSMTMHLRSRASSCLGYVRRYSSMLGSCLDHVWVCLGTVSYVWLCLALFGYVSVLPFEQQKVDDMWQHHPNLEGGRYVATLWQHHPDPDPDPDLY